MTRQNQNKVLALISDILPRASRHTRKSFKGMPIDEYRFRSQQYSKLTLTICGKFDNEFRTELNFHFYGASMHLRISEFVEYDEDNFVCAYVSGSDRRITARLTKGFESMLDGESKYLSDEQVRTLLVKVINECSFYNDLSMFEA